MSKQMAFRVDTSSCMNCKACQIACKDKNELPIGVEWRRVIQYGGGAWVADGETVAPRGVFTYSLSVACMHCAKPKCVEACPEHAIRKHADGAVLVDPETCVGRRLCEGACPYGALQFDVARGVMTKCDFCEDLLTQGRNPACVDACPTRALDAGPLEQLRAKYGLTNAIEPLPLPLTSPSIVITPHRHAQPSGKGTGRIIALPVKA